MTQKSYLARGVLYFFCAALPVLSTCLAAHLPWYLVVIDPLGAGLIALRAFIDKSPAEYHDAQKDETKSAQTDDAA